MQTHRAPAPVPPLFRALAAPLQSFARMEAASGILLASCALLALLWANGPWADTYAAVFDAPMRLGVGAAEGHFTFRAFINDGLMTLFFFTVGLEIKRELAVGELRTPSKALLPLVAAAGGMLVPGAIYFAINAGGDGRTGWAIPMATDIAFAIGTLSLLRKRVGHALIVFLTALAIFDDIGGIIVIALFYGSGLHLAWLLGALGLVGVLLACNRFGLRNGVAYLLLGLALWYCMHHGGVHATIAGVVVGMMVPALPRRPGREVLEELDTYVTGLVRSPAEEALRHEQIHHIEDRLEDVEPPLNRFLHHWHGYVAWVVVPLFALANSGVDLRGSSLSTLLAPVPLGIMAGLLVGKTVGVFTATLVAVKAGLAPVPGGAGLRPLLGVSMVAGIGFTVALFIAQLSFPGRPELLAEAKLGILLGSLLSAVLGSLLLRTCPPVREA